MSDDEAEDTEFDELELLDKRSLRCSFCIICGSEMYRTGLLICPDCIEDKCDDFHKAAQKDPEED